MNQTWFNFLIIISYIYISPTLFKRWVTVDSILVSITLVHQIVIYPVDSAQLGPEGQMYAELLNNSDHCQKLPEIDFVFLLKYFYRKHE